jgi:hypothetical protein
MFKIHRISPILFENFRSWDWEGDCDWDGTGTHILNFRWEWDGTGIENFVNSHH